MGSQWFDWHGVSHLQKSIFHYQVDSEVYLRAVKKVPVEKKDGTNYSVVLLQQTYTARGYFAESCDKTKFLTC